MSYFIEDSASNRAILSRLRIKPAKLDDMLAVDDADEKKIETAGYIARVDEDETKYDEMKMVSLHRPERVHEPRKTRRMDRDAYVDICMRSFLEYTGKNKRLLKNANDNLKKSRAVMVDSMRQIMASSAVLGKDHERRNNIKARFAMEYDKLRANKKIETIQAKGNVVSVFTKTIFCTNPETDNVHELGKYKISIKFPHVDDDEEVDPDLCEIDIHNRTRRSDEDYSIDAPHVRDGGACFGDAEETIMQLLARYELAALVCVLVQFLESVNPSDGWGSSIEMWPIVKRAKS